MTMTFTEAKERFIADWRAEGRINSALTERVYRGKLDHLSDTVEDRDPADIGRDDMNRALERWTGESRRQAHAIYRSFFRWAMTEGMRENNPADLVRQTKPKPPQIARLTREEGARLLVASRAQRRDRWLVHLGCCAGLRAQELRGLRGRHFARPGFVWVSPDIGKGQKERWVPVITDLEPIVEEILTLTGLEEFVLPGQRSAGHPTPDIMRDTTRPIGATTLYRRVVDLGEAAGIGVRVTPHSMRHLFSTYVARHGGILVAKALLGHADISTTQRYTDTPTLDELAISLHGFSFFGAVRDPHSKGAMP
jgi:integrase/recombinase XerD